MADRIWPPGCNGEGGKAPAGQRGPTGCLHHYPPGRNLAAEGCICPAWFDGGGWHIIDVNPDCASDAHTAPAGGPLAITPDGRLIPVSEFAEDDKWWCDCEDPCEPHVHSPNWGKRVGQSERSGGPVVTILVDLQTGMSIERTEQSDDG